MKSFKLTVEYCDESGRYVVTPREAANSIQLPSANESIPSLDIPLAKIFPDAADPILAAAMQNQYVISLNGDEIRLTYYAPTDKKFMSLPQICDKHCWKKAPPPSKARRRLSVRSPRTNRPKPPNPEFTIELDSLQQTQLNNDGLTLILRFPTQSAAKSFAKKYKKMCLLTVTGNKQTGYYIHITADQLAKLPEKVIARPLKEFSQLLEHAAFSDEQEKPFEEEPATVSSQPSTKVTSIVTFRTTEERAYVMIRNQSNELPSLNCDNLAKLPYELRNFLAHIFKEQEFERMMTQETPQSVSVIPGLNGTYILSISIDIRSKDYSADGNVVIKKPEFRYDQYGWRSVGLEAYANGITCGVDPSCRNQLLQGLAVMQGTHSECIAKAHQANADAIAKLDSKLDQLASYPLQIVSTDDQTTQFRFVLPTREIAESLANELAYCGITRHSNYSAVGNTFTITLSPEQLDLLKQRTALHFNSAQLAQLSAKQLPYAPAPTTYAQALAKLDADEPNRPCCPDCQQPYGDIPIGVWSNTDRHAVIAVNPALEAKEDEKYCIQCFSCSVKDKDHKSWETIAIQTDFSLAPNATCGSCFEQFTGKEKGLINAVVVLNKEIAPWNRSFNLWCADCVEKWLLKNPTKDLMQNNIKGPESLIAIPIDDLPLANLNCASTKPGSVEVEVKPVVTHKETTSPSITPQPVFYPQPPSPTPAP